MSSAHEYDSSPVVAELANPRPVRSSHLASETLETWLRLVRVSASEALSGAEANVWLWCWRTSEISWTFSRLGLWWSGEVDSVDSARFSATEMVERLQRMGCCAVPGEPRRFSISAPLARRCLSSPLDHKHRGNRGQSLTFLHEDPFQ